MFNNPYLKDSTSLDLDPPINSTIKQNRESFGVEIEGKERVLAPDMGGLYKAVGKPHSRGGMKVDLPDGSFVFSNDKSLALDETDHDLFELKKGGNFNKANNTPSKVLRRNVDENHYNSMIQKVTDPHTDEITKRSAGLMLNKYEDALGKIAFVQEGKKDFPTGIPEFAQDVAPVYATDVKDKIMEQDQYMKKGGVVNPYLPKARLGYFVDPYGKAKTTQGAITPTGESNSYNRGPEYLKMWEKNIPGISGWDNKRAQDAIYDYQMVHNPRAVKDMWGQYGNTNQGRQFKDINALTDNKGVFAPGYDAHLGELKKAYTDGMFGARQMVPTEPDTAQEPTTAVVRNYPVPKPVAPATSMGITPSVNTPAAPLEPGKADAPAVPGKTKDITWNFNPYQKANMAADALSYMSVKQEFPYRSQVQSPLVEMERMNPQAALNSVDNSTYQNYQNSRVLNPYMSAGNNMQAYGQALDAKNQIHGQYDNQNNQIANQQNLTNNQIQTRDQQVNVAADQQYYKESVEGRKNFDNLKQVAFNNLRSTYNDAVNQNQQLAYTLATQPNAPFDYNFKTGQFALNGKRSILDVQDPNAKGDSVIELVKSLKQQGYSDDLIGNIVKSKTIQNWNPAPQKKGGMINPYRKKK